MSFQIRRLEPFGVEVDCDLAQPLDEAGQAALRALLQRESLLLFRDQSLAEADQVRIMGHFGKVLYEEGYQFEIALDGMLGAHRLAYHSDNIFLSDPILMLSLYALEVDEGRTSTLFAHNQKVLDALLAELRERLPAMDARAVIPMTQVERNLSYETPDFLPQYVRPAVFPHAVTGVPTLPVTELQTSRIDGLPPAESEVLLQQLFDALYAPSNVYEHVWRNRDLLLWDNFALQHSRADQRAMTKRRLRRVCMGTKTFFECCPQFDPSDPEIDAWMNGQKLMTV
jgi:taurine dioxygenase